ncbi:hypothetical protein OA92_13425 [Marinomonas sp. SBI22]|uniref:hypothetical protein n=1 Tax=unclassified Marinomonas TaxID=196814 RepID=UPI0007AF0932|nr:MULTISPECIES: hypothetical protein [unclassified Marinomonas]KZM41412.1 hypothetical protein OA92_13425 [Marinomonas sp. SBI22]KZM43248.1 hypothetical protein OA91_11630 [Marinomonas sp. SBI8L]
MVDNIDALTYIKRFHSSPKILELSELSNIEMQSLPDSWIDILSKGEDKRLDQALKYWGKFEYEFPKLIERLSTGLLSVNLIHHMHGFCLMYGILDNSRGRVFYYEARNPKEKEIKRSIHAEWSRLPIVFREFYEFHDGWYCLASDSMGPSPSKNIGYLTDGLISPSEIRQCDLLDESRCLKLFSNGAGANLCADFSKKDISYLLWAHDDDPMLNVDLWLIMDQWTFNGLDY